MFRDGLALSTWLALGAVLQSLAYAGFGRVAFLPAVCVLLYRTADASATILGLKHNTYMDGVIMDRVSVQFPGEADVSAKNPADSDICVFILGSRVHQYAHARMFAPAY